MTPNAHIPTDLLTPLGAYLRLRDGAAASFLLESVEHGRLGRHSFIGSGTRIVGLEERQAGDSARVAARRSHSRHCSIPSPVRALTSSRSTPG